MLGSTAVTSTAAELNILDALAQGSIIYGNGSGATAILAAGTANQVLTSDGTDISWADAGGGGGGGSVSGDTFATDLKIGRDSRNLIDFATTNNKIIFRANNNDKLELTDDGLLLDTNTKIQFRDSDIHISSDANGYMNVQADTGVNINIGGTDELAITSATATFGTNIVIPNNGTIGSVNTPGAITISPGGAVAFAKPPSITEGLPIMELNIDGGADIGADLVDDDLIIVDDGANGTNRKCALSRLKTYIGSGRTIVSSSVEFTSSSSSIQTSNITIPADSLIVTVRMIVTETLQLSGSSDLGLNVGSNSSSYNNIINDSMYSVGFGVSSVSAENVYFNDVMAGTEGAYIENQTNVRINLKSNSGNFTDGTVKFILEYITMS